MQSVKHVMYFSVGEARCVDILIQSGADVNLSDIKAQTALVVAVKKKRVECVKQLLDAGADPDGDTQNLCSPLYVAAMEGFFEALKVIIIIKNLYSASSIH